MTPRTRRSWPKRGLVALTFIGLASTPLLVAWAASARSIALPDADWEIAAPVGGFAVTDDSQSHDGRTRLMAFEHRDQRLDVLVLMKPALSQQTLAAERAARWEQVQASEPQKIEERLIDQDGRLMLEYLVESARNGARTKHVHAFMRQDATSIEIHITLRSYKDSRQKQLDRLLETMRIVPRSEAG